MDSLPSPAHRYALLDALASLVAARGVEAFLRSPLLEPSAGSFQNLAELLSDADGLRPAVAVALSPETIAFVMAAQSVARGLSDEEILALTAHLDERHATSFHASYAELAKEPDAVRVTLGLAPSESWPAHDPLAALTLPRGVMRRLDLTAVIARRPQPLDRWRLASGIALVMLVVAACAYAIVQGVRAT